MLFLEDNLEAFVASLVVYAAADVVQNLDLESLDFSYESLGLSLRNRGYEGRRFVDFFAYESQAVGLTYVYSSGHIV